MARQKIDFKDIPKIIGGDLERVFRGAVFELYSRIIYGSVVGDPSTWSRPAPSGYVAGSFRGGWQIQIGASSYDPIIDKDGTSTINKGLQDLSKYKVGMKARIFNGQPHSTRLEFDSWSKRMPNGIVRVTVADWPQIVSEVAKAQRARR